METKFNNISEQQHDVKLLIKDTSFKPHCWGKMKWILKYPSGMEPNHAICRCEHGALKCKLLTRKAARFFKDLVDLPPEDMAAKL
jgi:hypothetical protein